MTASLADLLDELAATMRAVVGPAVTETEVQVTGRRNFNPTPPSIDIYPGDPFRSTPDSAGFGETGGELLLTVRARVTTVDNIAGQDLLLRLMDDEDAISVASTLMEDQTLGGLASSRLRGGKQRLHPLSGRRRGRGAPRLRVAAARAQGALVTVAAPPQAVTVDLLAGCARKHCLQMAGQLKLQLDPDYSKGAALLEIVDSFHVYRSQRRTARRRAARAVRLDYRFGAIERPAYAGDIHAINLSAPRRQGRPMSAAYRQRPSYGHVEFVCPRHHVYTYGVLDTRSTLVAYLWLYRSGELALVSSILGHAEHLENDVMYLLFLGMLERQYRFGGTVFYNRWDSGTEGLRFFKERLGLVEGDVEWALT